MRLSHVGGMEGGRDPFPQRSVPAARSVPEADPFPEGYLEKLARAGMNGVWMQCVLNNMAPAKSFPEFGRRADERIQNLNRLIERELSALMKWFVNASTVVYRTLAPPPNASR